MKSYYTVLYLLLLGVLSSCNDCETAVAQFQNGDATWTVYEPGDTLRMVDQSDTIRVFVHTLGTSEPIPGDGFGPGDACIEQYYTRRYSVMQHAGRRFPGLTVTATKTPDDVLVSLVVVNRAEVPIPDPDTPQLAQITLEGATYQDVFDLRLEPENDGGLSRILFNRAFGFLYVAYADGRTLTRLP